MIRKTLLLLALIAGLGLTAQDVMTPKLLWKLGRVSLEDVSADGKSFLYGVTRYHIDSNNAQRDLYLLSTDGGEPHRLTNLEGRVSGAQFLGEKVGYSYQGQFYQVNRDGTGRKALTDIEGGISGAKAYPQENGSVTLLFTKKFKTSRNAKDLYPGLPEAEVRIIDDLMYRHWDQWNDYKSTHLCLARYGGQPVENFQDLMENEPYDTPVPPFGGPAAYTLSPDGRYVVYESKKLTGREFSEQTNSQLYQVDLQTGQTELLTEDLEGYDKQPHFSPDGQKLAFLSMATNGYESDVNDLLIMDMESREIRRVLREAGRYDELTFHSLAWKDQDELIAGVPYQGSNQLFKVDLSQKTAALKQITSDAHNYNHFEWSGGTLLVNRQDMNHANEVYRVNPKNGEARQLTTVNNDIYSALNTSRVESRTIRTSDGKDMQTWVIYPPNFDPEKKYPTLLYCQGGPQAMVSQFYSFRWNFQLMAAQGYIVVAPNRRGLPGFGREWNEAISGDWGGQAMEDYLSAIDALAQEPYVDEKNLGCVGASYGGYSVYMLAGIHEGRFSSFISHCGLFNLESWYLATEEMWFANKDLGGPFWEEGNRETYERFDPKEYVDNWDTPLLVFHGGRDYRVPKNQGMEAFNAAQLQDVPSKFVYFPNEGHWILSPQNGLIWHDQFFKWLDRWLR
ncbi:MAG: S9 family peptidase [Schleiferiaceae bacterium]|nr:S9 family peptidase [Schleiferiaceae bacterium]